MTVVTVSQSRRLLISAGCGFQTVWSTVPDAAHQIFPAQDVQLRVQAGQIRFEKWQRGHRR